MALTRRSWKRLGLGVLALVAIVAGLALTRRDAPPAPDPPSGVDTPPVAGSSPPESLPPGVDRAPAPGEEDRLPQRRTALPAEVVLDPAAVPRLSVTPMRRALALFEARADEDTSGHLFALGDDGRVRSLDVVSLSPVKDPDGNQRSPFTPSALRADGVLAAFPQRDHVALLDLRNATVKRIPVPGFNEYLVWHGDEMIVAQSGKAFRVDAESGRATPTDERGFDVAAAAGPDAAVVELLDGVGAPPALGVHTDGRRVDRRIDGLQASARWSRPGWVSGRELAADLVTLGSDPSTNLAVVVNVDTGAPVRQLRTPPAAAGSAECCAVVGWLDQRTVALFARGPRNWLLAWDTATGQVTRLTEIRSPARTGVSIADLTP